MSEDEKGVIYDPVDRIIPRIETREQAIKKCESLVELTERARVLCDVPVPSEMSEKIKAKTQSARGLIFYMRYGSASAALEMAVACGKMDDIAFKKLKRRLAVTLVATKFQV